MALAVVETAAGAGPERNPMNTALHRRLIGLLGHLIGAFVVGLVAVAFLQVVLRYVFAAPLLWAEEVSVMALIWLCWIGAILSWLQGSHIVVDLVSGLMSAEVKRAFAIAFDLLALAGGTTLCLLSLQTLALFADFDLGSFQIPASIKYYPVTAGSAGLALAALLNLVSRLRRNGTA